MRLTQIRQMRPPLPEDWTARQEALEQAARGIREARKALKPWAWHRANVAELADVLADVERELQWMESLTANEEEALLP